MSTSRQRHRDKPDAGQGVTGAGSSERTFVIARNRQPDTKLPYLLRLPLEGGLGLKVRDTWPRSSRVYCHAFEEDWPKEADVLEEVPVLSCCRRGAAIDLVLDRPRLARSQFVFTEVRGRPAIFWQTQKTARTANPGGRVPRRRALPGGFTIAVDSRERYPYRFTGRDVSTEPAALPAGDYAVRDGHGLVKAAVERKELPLAAVVVEGQYPGLFASEHVSGAWLADILGRLEVRYPEVQVVFADSRRFAERVWRTWPPPCRCSWKARVEWAYRFLAAALADAAG